MKNFGGGLWGKSFDSRSLLLCQEKHLPTCGEWGLAGPDAIFVITMIPACIRTDRTVGKG
jgi:hypothetical protein